VKFAKRQTFIIAPNGEIAREFVDTATGEFDRITPTLPSTVEETAA
jgi:peroxiredoxin